MWEINNEDILDISFKDFQTKEILYEFDGPKIFTFEKKNILFFAYFSDIDYSQEEYRLIICITTEEEIFSLKNGTSSLDMVLKKNLLWIVDFDFEENHKSTTLIKDGYENIPANKKPKSGTLLWPHLEKAKLKEVSNFESGVSFLRLAHIRGIQETYSSILEKVSVSGPVEGVLQLWQDAQRVGPHFDTPELRKSDYIDIGVDISRPHKNSTRIIRRPEYSSCLN
ncbi:hypothetical protein [Comamonas sp. C24C]